MIASVYWGLTVESGIDIKIQKKQSQNNILFYPRSKTKIYKIIYYSWGGIYIYIFKV